MPSTTGDTSIEGTRAAPRAGTRSGLSRLNDAAYELLKERLLEGFFKLGERINPDSVVAEIGVSRQPVMDAMKRLAFEGFVEVIPQVGCNVVQPSATEIADFLTLLASVEGTCAELAAERASNEEIASLRKIVDDFEATYRDASTQGERSHAFRIHNREFHNRLHALTHSPVLMQVAMGFADRADFYIATAKGTHTFAERFEDAVEEHRRIADILSWRDRVVARRVIERHVLSFIATLQDKTG